MARTKKGARYEADAAEEVPQYDSTPGAEPAHYEYSQGAEGNAATDPYPGITFDESGQEVYYDVNTGELLQHGEAAPDGHIDEYAGATGTAVATADIGDGNDYSDWLDEDDGFNQFRTITPHDTLMQADMQALAEYRWFVNECKRKLTAEFEDRKRMMQRQIDACEKAVRQQMEKRKLRSQNFTFDVDGEAVSMTLTPTHETHYKVEDWQALYGWIMDNGAVDVLQKRIAETNMKDCMDQLQQMVNEGTITPEQAVIPGVSLTSVPVLQVSTRKPKKKAA